MIILSISCLCEDILYLKIVGTKCEAYVSVESMFLAYQNGMGQAASASEAFMRNN